MTDEFVYHFTDTARLPWILESAELRPGANKIGGFPVDFVWATTSPAGSRTATACVKLASEKWRAGETRLVRFTLPAAHFVTWHEILEQFPAWTPEHRRILENSAHDWGDAVDTWRCRAELLPLTADLPIHTRSYEGGWRLLEKRVPVVIEGYKDVRGILIEDLVYAAVRTIRASGLVGYSPQPPVRYKDLAKAAATVQEIQKDGTG